MQILDNEIAGLLQYCDTVIDSVEVRSPYRGNCNDCVELQLHGCSDAAAALQTISVQEEEEEIVKCVSGRERRATHEMIFHSVFFSE